MITADIELNASFNRGLAALIHDAGLNARKVVEKESGELIKTLVRLTPPKEPAKTRASISKNLSGRFEHFGQANNYEGLDVKPGANGLKYYAANSKYLFAGAADSDMRKSSQADLLAVYYRARTIQKHTRLVVPFKNRRTQQRLAIITRIIVQKKQINELTRRIQSHVGRFKAGWLVAVMKGAIKITGGYQPPQWVTRHMNQGIRGYFVDGLATPKFPNFTIANTAKGAGRQANTYFLNAAVKVRAKAMQANALLFMKGKKNVADYAKN